MSDTEISVLIEEYVTAHPLSGSGLSSPAKRYAAGRLMLLQTDRETALAQSATESSRFAACLFVLIVQECLIHRRRRIFGVEAETVHSILLEHVKSVPPAALLQQLETLDLEGTAKRMANEPGCIEYLYEAISEVLATVDEGEDEGEDDANSEASLTKRASNQALHEAADAPAPAAPPAPAPAIPAFPRSRLMQNAGAFCAVVAALTVTAWYRRAGSNT